MPCYSLFVFGAGTAFLTVEEADSCNHLPKLNAALTDDWGEGKTNATTLYVQATSLHFSLSLSRSLCVTFLSALASQSSMN